MPAETAATLPISGLVGKVPLSSNFWMAIFSATNAPVMLAVRVPPSAWMTSQSIKIWRSPSRLKSTQARRLRPMSR